MVAAVPSGTMISSAMLETVLRLLPLQTGWEDSTGTLSISLNGEHGDSDAAVGDRRRSRACSGGDVSTAGSSRCTRMRGADLYWVTKTDPIVVRSVLDVPAMGGAQL